MSQGFRTSAPKRKNGFIKGRIVSLPGLRRNTQGKNVNNFKLRKIAGNRIPAMASPERGLVALLNQALSPAGENK
jgi:hypothetical protein